MAKSSYVVTNDFKTPYVVSTGLPHRPTKIEWKQFVKGDIINGELKHANGKPVFVLLGETLVVPLDVIKAVVTQEIDRSNADGTPSKPSSQKTVIIASSKTKYFDAALVGIALGIGAVILAEKKQWIKVPNKMNKVYGGGIGLVLAVYGVYRFSDNKPKNKG